MSMLSPSKKQRLGQAGIVANYIVDVALGFYLHLKIHGTTNQRKYQKIHPKSIKKNMKIDKNYIVYKPKWPQTLPPGVK